MGTRTRHAWLLLLSLLVTLAACQRTREQLVAERTPVALQHYFSFSGGYANAMDAIAQDFNAAETRYHLQPTSIDHELFKHSIRDDLQRHRTADLYTYWAGARVQSIVESLQPIDDALPVAEMNKLFGTAVVQSACSYNGRVYFVPIAQHYVGFIYNKKLFAALGLQPPKTWRELLDVAHKLKAHGTTPFALGSKARWPAQFWFDYLLLRTAPLAYRQKLMAGEASFEDREVQRVFGMWRDLVKAGMFNPQPNALDFNTGAGMLVRRGEAAMTLMGTWLIGYLESPEVGWHEGTDFGFFPFPVIEPGIPPVALGPIDGLVLPRDAKNPAGAKAAMRFFANAGSEARISRAMGSIAPNILVLDRHYSPLKQAIRAEILRNRAWAFNYDLATAPDRAEIGLNLFTTFLDAPDDYPAQLRQTASRMAQLGSAEARTAQ
ncbi:ABC transporter substrate-binding protein [Niveibacterium umoris]|uniref:ABC transporter substrate-binding protein n=1 Tax=Niveibacterium umoris TaxID=1193620 RepID=UPI001C8546AC|nr:extracellular solute-binding protein [Niveibacterium umoris]